MIRHTLRFAILATALLACRDGISGTVTAIADGDTLTLLHNAREIRVRLVEIDAPESSQPFGRRSRQALADRCFKKSARVETKGQDRYGRTLGRVWCDGVDVNEAQVRDGMAWVYDEYVTDRDLYDVQSDARDDRRGLWADSGAMAPWAWRSSH
jgi:endonuclease YncB( thermonuclease family)